jgi:two-component system, LytTR family, response regulator
MKTIIIDDELDCVKLLSLQLKLTCPEINIVAECTQSLEGIKLIQDLKPDIVFLDIEMPRLNGFQMLEALGEINFSLVFVTAYDKFAVKAFRYAAIDYLLKPIETKELQDCIKKIEKQLKTDQRQLDMLKSQYSPNKKIHPDKIALPFQNGVSFVLVEEIIYCEADDNYTKFYLKNGQVCLVSKTLRDIQETLEERNFLRVHRQFLINLNHINRYVKGEGNYLVMTNEVSIPVARNQKEKLVERFGWL